MSKQILINQTALAIATVFLILAGLSKNFWLTAAGLVMIVISNVRIKKLKDEGHDKD